MKLWEELMMTQTHSVNDQLIEFNENLKTILKVSHFDDERLKIFEENGRACYYRLIISANKTHCL